MFYLLHADESSTTRGNLKSVSILRVSLTMAKLSSSLVVFCILSLAFLLTSYQNVEAFTGPLPGRERQMRQTSSQFQFAPSRRNICEAARLLSCDLGDNRESTNGE